MEQTSDPVSILIVEDESIVAMDLGFLLEHAGYRVSGVADNGNEALTLAGQTRPDIAFVDIRLRGGMDGIELAHRLRSKLNVPVIFATAHGDTATVARASAAQPFGYVVKPFEERDLRIAIEVARARYLAEAKVKRLERWLATTLHSIGDAILVADLQGNISLMNAAAERLSGWSCREALGRRISEVFAVSIDGQDCAAEIIGRMFEGDAVVQVMDNAYLRTRLGELIPIDDSVAPTHDDQGRLSGVVIIFRDRSAAAAREERKRRLEAKVHEAQKLESLGVLTGGIAHDFNNLLGVVLGNVSLIETRLTDPELLGCLSNVAKAALRGADLCAQMLAYAGFGQLLKEAIDLNASVERALQQLHVSLGKNVQLKLALEPDLPSIVGDPIRIQQVITNLVINSAEAIGEGSGTIIVRTSVTLLGELALADEPLHQHVRPGRYVTLEVQDDGPGMSDEVMKCIFDPFFTTKFTGRGLGLAAVRGIVDTHEGLLELESALCRGTTFRVHLPLPAHREAVPSTPDEQLREIVMSGHVLVVDDDEPMRLICGAMLEELGFEVSYAKNAYEAILHVSQDRCRYRLVVMDMIMPELSGVEAADRLRQIDPALPVLLMSGYTEEAVRTLADSASIAGFLGKPFTLSDLQTKVSATLRELS